MSKTNEELLADYDVLRQFGGGHFHDGVSEQDGRRALAYLAKLDEDQRERANCEAFLQVRMASIAASRREDEERARREREDPLTFLPVQLQPTAPDDLVFLGVDIPTGEFRRADGRRYKLKSPGIVACIPAADATEEQCAKATGVGSEFNDLLALVARQRRRLRDEWRVRTNNPFATPPNEYPPIDHACAMIGDTGEPMLLVIAQWGAFARANPTEGRNELAAKIRKHLDALGKLGLMLSPEEIMRGA